MWISIFEHAHRSTGRVIPILTLLAIGAACPNDATQATDTAAAPSETSVSTSEPLASTGADSDSSSECEGGACDECEIGDCTPPPPVPDAGGPCESEAPTPSLPYPAGTFMGVTYKPNCGGHTGKLAHAYDFNVSGTYETDNDLVASASSSGTVTEVVDWVTGGCADCSGPAYNGGWGNCVIIQLDGTCLFERYCHLDVGSVFVEEGQHVCRGEPVGLIGSTGRSSGPHLHWQRERLNGQSVSVPTFAETAIEPGCEWCNIPTNQSGCYGSQNGQLDQCAPPPPSPCEGLLDGDYCGSSGALNEYPGNPSDLVTCTSGAIDTVISCTNGCQENPPGQDDECIAGEPTPFCGDGKIDPGESCDAGNLNGATCQTQGFDGGTLGCTGVCTLDTGLCCNSECSPPQTQCTNATMESCGADGNGCYQWTNPTNCPNGCDGDACSNVSCGDGVVDQGEQCDGQNLNGLSCTDLGYDGGQLSCTGSCTYSTSGCCEVAHDILNAEYPSYTTFSSGCTLGDPPRLKLAAKQISPTIMRFYVKKTDDTPWGSPATLRLYVGDGPTCGDPPNIVKVTQPVDVGETTQLMDLTIDPYQGGWPLGELKQFWVGKSESIYESARATGTISITRDCE